MKNLDTNVNGYTNTNLKFLEELKKIKTADELNNIIDIGTCNLHTVYGAFETGILSSGWNTKKLLKGAYCALHDTRDVREDYINITSQKSTHLHQRDRCKIRLRQKGL